MYLTEQYCMYRLAYYLVKEEKYDILHINNEKNEVWLKKQIKKKTNIIRFVHHGFNWRNHLKSDIAYVFHQVKMMKKLLAGKQIYIYNIYVTADEPVDDWESLKKTMVLKEKKPLQMNVFYLTEGNFHSEESRLFKKIDLPTISMLPLPSETIQKKDTSFYKTALNKQVYLKSKEIKQTLFFGKPRVTYLFIFINLIIFAMLELNGGSMNIETLVQYGAKFNPYMYAGEWWRLISSMFLHIGILHLALNMIALYYLGAITERIFGSIRFIIIYFLAGIAGSLTSFAFNVHISAGASGALFGLFGALLFFGVIHKHLFQQTLGKNIIPILIVNLLLGFLIPQIDMGAHLGGLICGFLAAAITHIPRRHHIYYQALALFSYLSICLLLLYYAF